MSSVLSVKLPVKLPVKFCHQRKWLRKSFYMGLAGMTLISGCAASPDASLKPQAAPESIDLSVQTDNGTSATYSTGTGASNNDPLQKAVDLATQAEQETQSAKTKADWQAAATTWQSAISLLGTVPASDANYNTAQTKIADYSKNLASAQNNANK